MAIGIAIVVAMVLYLIDRNKVWKQAGKIAAVLTLLAALFVVGIVGWAKYGSSRAAQGCSGTPPSDAQNCVAVRRTVPFDTDL